MQKDFYSQLINNNMETETKKPRIYINPPPPDFHCEICGRPFEELPLYPDHFKTTEIFKGHVVYNKEHTEIRLFKTYRGSIQISASWECFDCLNSATIDDVSDYFITDYPENDYPTIDGDKMEQFLDLLKEKCMLTKEEYFYVVDPSGESKNEWMFNTRYWRRYFGMYGDNYKNNKV